MRIRGLSKFELVAVIFIIMAAASVAVPQFFAARQDQKQRVCNQKLDRVNFAKEQWALENRKPAGSLVTKEELVPAYITHQSYDEAAALPNFEIQPVGSKSTCDCGKE